MFFPEEAGVKVRLSLVYLETHRRVPVAGEIGRSGDWSWKLGPDHSELVGQGGEYT